MDDQIETTKDRENRTRWEARILQLRQERTQLNGALKTDREVLQPVEHSQESFAEWQRNLKGLKEAIAGDDAVEARIRLQSHLREFIEKIEIFSDGFTQKYDPDVPAVRRSRALGMNPSEEQKKKQKEAWQQLGPTMDEFAEWYDAGVHESQPKLTPADRTLHSEFADYVVKRRMSWEGRFFRIRYRTGASLDVKPESSLAFGWEAANSRQKGLRSVGPDLGSLWRQFMATKNASHIAKISREKTFIQPRITWSHRGAPEIRGSARGQRPLP